MQKFILSEDVCFVGKLKEIKPIYKSIKRNIRKTNLRLMRNSIASRTLTSRFSFFASYHELYGLYIDSSNHLYVLDDLPMELLK